MSSNLFTSFDVYYISKISHFHLCLHFLQNKESGQNPAHYAPVITVIAKQKRGKACKFAYEIEGGKSSLLKGIRIIKTNVFQPIYLF
jgi:hypothetical protein